MARKMESIEVERIFLYEENPRHEPIESEPEIIDYLCKDEQVYNLARSIAEAGPNPLELVGVVETGDAKAAKKNYQVLTYDYCDEIHDLYTERRQFQFSLNYSLHNKRLGTELLIASKGLRIPDEFRAAQVHRPQYRTAA